MINKKNWFRICEIQNYIHKHIYNTLTIHYYAFARKIPNLSSLFVSVSNVVCRKFHSFGQVTTSKMGNTASIDLKNNGKSYNFSTIENEMTSHGDFRKVAFSDGKMVSKL